MLKKKQTPSAEFTFCQTDEFGPLYQPDDEVFAVKALAVRMLLSLSVDPGPSQVLALESQNHLDLEAFICLHWN